LSYTPQKEEKCSDYFGSFGGGIGYFNENYSYNFEATINYILFGLTGIVKYQNLDFSKENLVTQAEFTIWFLLNFGVGATYFNSQGKHFQHIYIGMPIPHNLLFKEYSILYFSPYYRYIFDYDYHEFGILIKFTINDKNKF